VVKFSSGLYLPGVEASHQPGITATGVPEMSPEAHRQQGQNLAARGYIRD
jgi:hypothetical protein